MGVILNIVFLLFFQFYINPFDVGNNYVESKCYTLPVEDNSFDVACLKDDTGAFTFSDVRHLPDQEFDLKSEMLVDNGGIYWLRITKLNAITNERYILLLNDQVERIDVFSAKDSIHPEFSGGLKSTSAERKLPGLGYASVCFDSNESPVYVRIKTIKNIHFQLNTIRVCAFSTFLKVWKSENLIQFFFAGTLFVLFLIVLILSAIFKRRYQLYFSLCLLSIFLRWIFAFNLAEIIVGDLPKLELFMNWMVFPAQIFFLLFVLNYFTVKAKHPFLYKVSRQYFVGQLSLALLAAITFFFNIVLFYHLISILVISGLGFCIFAIIMFWDNLTFTQKMIFAGIVLLFLLNVLFVFLGISSHSYLNYHVFQISRILVSMAIVILLGFDAFDLLNFFKVQKETLEQITLKSESLEAKYHMMLAEIAEQEKLVSAKNIQLAHVNDMLQALEHENPEIKMNREFDQWKKNTVDSTQNWHEFDAWFNHSNEVFFRKLHLKHPDLSINDRRLCGFLKLDMSTKDISELSRKSINTIDVARYRLRQKLGLGANININSYLLSIENDTVEQFVQHHGQGSQYASN